MAALSATLLRYVTNRAAASTPDAVLLQRFISKRDEDAFAGLVRRHGPLVYRICRRLVGPASADDAFQATFLVLATRAATVRKLDSVGSWLVGVAGRVARQMRKSERRREAREHAATPVPVRALETDYLEAAEQARILDDELTRLSDRLRGPVVVCLLQGRTYEQAAAELGGSARTIRRRLDQAKCVLRARLERRGIVPAIAAGLVAGIRAADAAVPAGLCARTLAAVSGFLAGGATIPAALIAKGVATTMTTNVRLMAALVATAAAGLTALGVGLAGDGKETLPPAPPSPHLPAVPPPAANKQPPPGAVAVFPPAPAQAPSDGALRAIENEARFLREAIGRRWFGPDWRPGAPWKLDLFGAVRGSPVPPPPADAIRIIYYGNGPASSDTRLTFDGSPNNRMTRAWVDLSGELSDVIDNYLPREVTHLILGEFYGRPLPWWAAEGMAADAESPAHRVDSDLRCRQALKEGRCLRLTALLNFEPHPNGGGDVPAQAHSVVRFLLTRKGMAPEQQVMGADQRTFRLSTDKGAFLYFLRSGIDGDWDRAGKDEYGFANVAALEDAWLDWMKRKASHVEQPARVVQSAVPAYTAPLIPPVKLP